MLCVGLQCEKKTTADISDLHNITIHFGTWYWVWFFGTLHISRHIIYNTFDNIVIEMKENFLAGYRFKLRESGNKVAMNHSDRMVWYGRVDL